jgi:hypothetical protein
MPLLTQIGLSFTLSVDLAPGLRKRLPGPLEQATCHAKLEHGQYLMPKRNSSACSCLPCSHIYSARMIFLPSLSHKIEPL